MTTTIVADLENIAAVKHVGHLTFRSGVALRSDGTSRIVTEYLHTVKPVNGVVTVELVPGPAILQFGGTDYPFTVPEDAGANVPLWPLIETYIEVPPETAEQKLDAAIERYVADNPIDGLPPGGTIGQVLTILAQGAGWANPSGGGGGASTVDGLTDASAIGKSIAKAANAAAVRQLIDAATPAQVTAAVNAVVAAAPGALDTLDELAAALGDDPNFATTITNLIGAKYTKPAAGIPRADLVAAVQASLALADAASQPGHKHPASDLTAAGTRDGTTFLRGDNTWAVPAGGGAATFAVPRMSMMMLGDSLSDVISAYDAVGKVDSHRSGNAGGHSPGDWGFQGNLLAGSPMDILGSAATAGMTAQQIKDTHLPTVLAAKPTYCTVLAGANDALAAGDSYTPATIAIIQSMCIALEAAGIIPILCTIPPAIAAGLSQVEIDRMNSWAMHYANTHGYPLLDFYSVLVDPATGGYKAGYSAQESGGYLHPTGLGSAQQALVVRDLILKLTSNVGSRAQLAMYNGIGGVAANPLLAPAGGTGSTPDGYYITGAPTMALAASPNAGNRFSMTRTAQDGAAFAPSVPCAEGDVWDLCLRIGATVPAGGKWALALLNQTGGVFQAIAYDQVLPVPAGTVLHWRGKVAAGNTSIAPYFAVAAVAGTKLEIEQVTLRNLTAKGVIVA